MLKLSYILIHLFKVLSKRIADKVQSLKRDVKIFDNF